MEADHVVGAREHHPRDPGKPRSLQHIADADDVVTQHGLPGRLSTRVSSQVYDHVLALEGGPDGLEVEYVRDVSLDALDLFEIEDAELEPFEEPRARHRPNSPGAAGNQHSLLGQRSPSWHRDGPAMLAPPGEDLKTSIGRGHTLDKQNFCTYDAGSHQRRGRNPHHR